MIGAEDCSRRRAAKTYRHDRGVRLLAEMGSPARGSAGVRPRLCRRCNAPDRHRPTGHQLVCAERRTQAFQAVTRRPPTKAAGLLDWLNGSCSSARRLPRAAHGLAARPRVAGVCLSVLMTIVALVARFASASLTLKGFGCGWPAKGSSPAGTAPLSGSDTRPTSVCLVLSPSLR